MSLVPTLSPQTRTNLAKGINALKATKESLCHYNQQRRELTGERRKKVRERNAVAGGIILWLR